MNAWLKRLSSGITALAVLVSAGAVMLSAPSQNADAASTPIFSAECEDLEITNGASVATQVYGDSYEGYSGSGFVWAPNSGGFSFDVNVTTGGMYTFSSRCWMYLTGDPRLQTVAVDGTIIGSYYVPNNSAWIDFTFGNVYLSPGTHSISFGDSGSWGFILYDTVSVSAAKTSSFNLSDVPCDTNATSETKALMKYLNSQYGEQIISGQQEIYGGGNNGDTELEFEYIHDKTGKYPVIRGYDFMNYNPLYGWEDGTTGRIIQWVAQRGGIATASWHINVPQDFTSYTLGETLSWEACTYKPTDSFNTANCLVEGTKERDYLMLAIEDLAEQLLILQDNDIPIILRPFHEAEGNNNTDGSGAWFWWGSGGAEVYKELWKLLYDTLTNDYGIHNCIWEVNLYDYANSGKWYPGDDCVDMVAYDKYEGSPYTWGTSAATTVFLTLVDHTNDAKMVALAENDKIPDIDNMVNEGAWWSYFCPWYGNFITDGSTNTIELLDKNYNSEYVLTLDEVPNDIYGYERGNGGNWDVEGAYECEDGNLTMNDGSSKVDYSLCSGTGYVFLQGANDAIEQTVTVSEAGTYSLVYCYQQHYETAGKTQNLYVNGESVGTAFFPHSLLFTQSDPINVTLKAGSNTIKLEAVEGWTYYDYLLVTESNGEDPEEPIDTMLGDMNNDKKIDVRDVAILAKAVGGVTELSAQARLNADLTGDGNIDIRDVAKLAKAAAGVLTL